MRDWIRSNCKFAQTEPWRQRRDEWALAQMPPGLTFEQIYADDRLYKQMRELERQWTKSMSGALAHGLISKEDAGKRRFHFDGPMSNVGPMPELLYHVTTNKAGVLQHGLKSRRDLNQNEGGGLGGGPDETISFTADLQTARDIKRALLEGRAVARGELTLPEMIEMARSGRNAKRPWLPDWFDYYFKQEPEDERGQIPLYIQSGIDGVDHSGGAWPQSEAAKNAKEPGKNWIGEKEWPHHGEGQPKNYVSFKRKMTQDELRKRRFELFKSFSAFREHAGGEMDPLFFGSDPEYLANVQPEQFAIMAFKPKPGRQGYQVSALGEWRTWAGDAVDLVGEVN